MLNRPGPEAHCRYLNEGKRNGQTTLTRNSIRAARKSFDRQLRGPGAHAVLAQTATDASRLEAMESLRLRAKDHPRFRRYQGAALAIAIHNDFDLNESIWRAQRRLALERASPTAA
jgi:hypothetical protein